MNEIDTKNARRKHAKEEKKKMILLINLIKDFFFLLLYDSAIISCRDFDLLRSDGRVP